MLPLLGTLSCGRLPSSGPGVVDARAAGCAPRVRPDYSGTVVPASIAPLNFVVQESGRQYVVELSGERGGTVTVNSNGPEIRIPGVPWRQLLTANRGAEVRISVTVRSDDGQWLRFEPIVNRVADDEIDGYLVYRYMRPIYNYWDDIGIYQRDLSCFGEELVLGGRLFDHGCTNCHTFRANGTDCMTVGIRSSTYGSSTLLYRGGKVTKLGTKWGYTSWHPSGTLAAYSLNKVRQFFHPAGIEVRDVVDLDSDIVVYDADSNTVVTTPAVSDPDRLETYPTWTPDGTYLYYCSAPFPWSDRKAMPPKNYRQIRYSLMRVRYDAAGGGWGDAETVVSADEEGQSVLLPRFSPDGRYLLFCMCAYGCFPIYQPTSDLYLMDVQTGDYRRLGINSDRSESWHSWSSNSRWFVFSSKRRDGLLTRSYICHVDEDGHVGKPFILPQRDPMFYDSLLKGYTVPELVREPVQAGVRELARAVRSSHKVSLALPELSMTRKKAGPTSTSTQDHPWQQSRR